jgi:fumarylacetoacetase
VTTVNYPLDETHDPELTSWVESANHADGDFPLQNLPFGRFRTDQNAAWRIGVAIGDQILDLHHAGLINDAGNMRTVLEFSLERRRELRHCLSRGLRRGSTLEAAWQQALHPQSAVELGLPCTIENYTDFYSGIHHATAVGKLFRPDNPLLPNYKWLPIAYHGRASTLIPSGQAFPRPMGQLRSTDQAIPVVAPSQRLDFEVELGFVVGRGNNLGHPIALKRAEEHIFGVVLLNDWSARDIQAWEYQPLGPFLAKNFATSLSPWVVTLEALTPFRQQWQRVSTDPQPLPYLESKENRSGGALNIELTAWLQTAKMRQNIQSAERLSIANYADAAYWTFAQLLAHHTVNGCRLCPGDLLGTGTLSGPLPSQAGSLLELTQAGSQPLTLANDEQRSFLHDGDSVTLRGRCERSGFRSIGFGTCTGTVHAPKV